MLAYTNSGAYLGLAEQGHANLGRLGFGQITVGGHLEGLPAEFITSAYNDFSTGAWGERGTLDLVQ